MPPAISRAVPAAELQLPVDAAVHLVDEDQNVAMFLVHDPARGWAVCEHRLDGIIHRFTINGRPCPAYFGDDRTGHRGDQLVFVRGIGTAHWWATLTDLLLDQRLSETPDLLSAAGIAYRLLTDADPDTARTVITLMALSDPEAARHVTNQR